MSKLYKRYTELLGCAGNGNRLATFEELSEFEQDVWTQLECNKGAGG